MFYYYIAQYFLGTVGEIEGTPTPETDNHLNIVAEMFPGGYLLKLQEPS